METKANNFREGVTFDYGFSGGAAIYVTVPMSGLGYSIANKASHTGGNCFCTGSTRGYGTVNPVDVPASLTVPVIRFDKATVDAALKATNLGDTIRPYVLNPGWYTGSLRTYLEAVEALGVPVDYPEGWDWSQHEQE